MRRHVLHSLMAVILATMSAGAAFGVVAVILADTVMLLFVRTNLVKIIADILYISHSFFITKPPF
ncbi:secreted protein [gut metagenome]|uniref:Secreted protein n=1 Tax=gut metagenome TaxID=749906 RepID=J9GK65_9ZZZZ